MIADNRSMTARMGMGVSEIFETRPAWHDIGPNIDSPSEFDRGKRQKLPDGGCKGPQISRGKNKHRDRY